MTAKSGWCSGGEGVGAGRTNVCPGTFTNDACPCGCHVAVSDLLDALADYGPTAAALIVTTINEGKTQ